MLKEPLTARRIFPFNLWWVILLSFLANGCTLSTHIPDRTVDYRRDNTTLPQLELPPDLSNPVGEDALRVPDINTTQAGASPSRLSSGGQVGEFFPTSLKVSWGRVGERRYLITTESAGLVWQKVRTFWTDQGFAIKWEDAKLGTLETDWAENREDIPKNAIQGLFSKFVDNLYSAPTRDKYRTRLERGAQSGTAEIYITHKGIAEVSQGDNIVWAVRPSNPELEIEMLNRLFLAIGGEKSNTVAGGKVSDLPEVARLINTAEDTHLVLFWSEAESFRRLGMALDRLGFQIEAQSVSESFYQVRYADAERESDSSDKQGWLSKLAFWQDSSHKSPSAQESYRLELAEQNAKTTQVRIVPVNDQEKSRAVSIKILNMLYENLRP